MPDSPDTTLNRWRIVSMLCALLAGLIGILGLLGWVLDSAFLRSFLSDGATMKVNTALLIILGATALALLNKGRDGIAKVFLVLIILISIIILGEHLLNAKFYIDNLFATDRFTNPKLEIPGRTSLLTALNTLLIGCAMLLISVKKHRTAQLLAAGVFLLVYLSLMGHLFHISGFYKLGVYSGIAFHTALALLLLSVGVLTTEPQQGWTGLVYQRLRQRSSLLYFLSYSLGAAPLFAAIYLFVIQNGALSPSSDVVVLIALTLVLSLPVAYLLLRLVNRMTTDLNRAGQRLEIALDAANLGSYDLDLESGIMTCSDQCKKNFGLPAEADLNFPELMNAIIPEHREHVQANIKAAIDNKINYHAEY